MKKIMVSFAVAALAGSLSAAIYSTSFDSHTFSSGDLHGQDNWVAQSHWKADGVGGITNAFGAFIRAHNAGVLGSTNLGEVMTITSTFQIGGYTTPSADIADWEEGIFAQAMSHQNGVMDWNIGLAAGIFYDVGTGNVELRAMRGRNQSGTTVQTIGAASTLGGTTFTLNTAFTKIAADTWSITAALFTDGLTVASLSYTANGYTSDLDTDSDGGGILGGIMALPCSIGAAGVANGPFGSTKVSDYSIEVIPEPATWALVAVVAGASLFIRCRFLL